MCRFLLTRTCVFENKLGLDTVFELPGVGGFNPPTVFPTPL